MSHVNRQDNMVDTTRVDKKMQLSFSSLLFRLTPHPPKKKNKNKKKTKRKKEKNIKNRKKTPNPTKPNKHLPSPPFPSPPPPPPPPPQKKKEKQKCYTICILAAISIVLKEITKLGKLYVVKHNCVT